MGARYQVVGEAAHVEGLDVSGAKTVFLLYKGAPLPDGVDEKRLKHLIESGLIAEVGETPIAPNASEPQDPAVGIRAAHKALGGNTGEQQPDGDPDDAKRAEAKAKLKQNADGSYALPHANAGEDVWVEYAATQGVDRGEATKAGRDELKKLFADKK